ncbi:hypothetical protein [Methanolapillus africanus]
MFASVHRFTGELYHGTTKENAAKILQDNFTVSTKSSLHLGKGVYFFDNEMYAVWWMIRGDISKKIETIACEKNAESDIDSDFCREIHKYFEMKFGVISVVFQDIRYLDLDNPKNKEIVAKAYKKFQQKNEMKTELKDFSIYDYLYDHSAVMNQYDMFVLTTNFYKFGNRHDLNRFHLDMPYKIYCVKNTGLFQNKTKVYISLEIIRKCLKFMILKEKIYGKRRRTKMENVKNEIHETTGQYRIKAESEEDVLGEDFLQEVQELLDNMTLEEFYRVLDEYGNSDDDVPYGPFFMSCADYERLKGKDPAEIVKELGW